MNRLAVYHALPAPARTIAAGLHGARLARRRYGPETERLVDEALERERLSPESWRRWIDARLERVLERAAAKVPYYRSLRRDGADYRRLSSWPLLDKATVQRQGLALVADDVDPRTLAVERTSGSTGTPLKLWRSIGATRARYALYEARHRGWYGFSRHDRWAMAGGQLVVPRDAARPPFWVWNAPMRQLYVSSYHTSPDQLRCSVDAIVRRGCRYLWGYPSTLAALGDAARRDGRRLSLGVAVANAEPLSPKQREAIERGFGCAARATYGMVELVAGAGECGHGRLHLFPELGRLEVLRDDGRISDYGEGELIATSLLDQDMPLIRYRTGDRVRLEPPGDPCPCGRTLPVLGAVEGRLDDILYSADGRPVGRLDPVFKDDLPILEAQIIQHAFDRVQVLVVPRNRWDRRSAHRLTEALQARLGPVQVDVGAVQSIPRGANGKLRATICRIPAQEKFPGRFRAAC